MNSADPRGSVLPDSIRRFSVDFGDKTAGFGKYSVEGNFGYGTKGHLLSASTTFYVIPLLYIIIALVLLALIVLSFFIFPRIIKTHDRNLIRKMRGRKNKD